MNLAERRNLKFRLIASGLLLLSIGLIIYCLITIAMGNGEDKLLSIIACGLAVIFAFAEFVIIIKGWKKEVSLYRIAFNDNGVINNVSLIAIIIGTLLGSSLSVVSLVLLIIKGVEPFITSCLVILSIGMFLLINCLIYYIFLIMYRKRQFKLEDYAK